MDIQAELAKALKAVGAARWKLKTMAFANAQKNATITSASIESRWKNTLRLMRTIWPESTSLIASGANMAIAGTSVAAEDGDKKNGVRSAYPLILNVNPSC